MAGRPLRTQGIMELIAQESTMHPYLLERIANGDSMRDIATEEGYTLAALMAFLSAPERRQSLLDARASAAAAMVSDSIQIADNGADTSAPDPARDKLRVQARQWAASRMDRAAWGQQSGPSVEVNVANLYLGAMRTVQPDENALVIDAVADAVADPAEPAAVA